MKNLIVLLGLIVAGTVNGTDHDAVWGARNGAAARIDFQVVDTAGNPVVGAEVRIGYTVDHPRLKKWKEAFVTDASGCVTAKGYVNRSIGISVDKDGYYESFEKIILPKTKSEPAIVDGKWQPYGEKRKIVLKQYKNPIDMPGISEYWDADIPVFGEWIPFDIEKSSWVAPYGNGKQNDVLLRFELKEGENKYWDYFATMEISFTNSVFGGFYIEKKDDHSEMVNAYTADTTREFVPYAKFFFDGNDVSGRQRFRLDDDEYMVFRTRTRVDDNGNLVSAHYGKFLGCWSFKREMRIKASSFNLTPNDTNLEDMETCVRSQQRRKHERERRQR